MVKLFIKNIHKKLKKMVYTIKSINNPEIINQNIILDCNLKKPSKAKSSSVMKGKLDADLFQVKCNALVMKKKII